MGLNLGKDLGGLEDEDAGVPEIPSVGHISLCRLQVRFLKEAFDLEQTLGFHLRTDFDVPIPSLGPNGFDPEGDERASLRSLYCPLQISHKFLRVGNRMIRRQHHHDRFGREVVQVEGGQAHGRSGVSSQRFVDEPDLFCQGAQRVNVKPDILGLILRGHNPDIFPGDKAMDPFDRLAEKGILSDNLQHLLRPGLTAQRPETGARAAGENHGVDIRPEIVSRWTIG